MNRVLSIIAISCLLITAACGGKTPPQQAALQGQSILSALRAMSQSYENENLDSFLSHVSDKYKDRQAFSDAVSKVFKKYQAIHFNIQYKKMLILVENKGQIKATYNWDAEWQASTGTVQKDGARVTMVFDPGEYRLLSIEGKNPFVPGEK